MSSVLSVIGSHMSASTENLIWIDLEMTGLDPDKDRIIEIATIVTDSHLNIVAEGPNLVVHQEDALLDGMDAWNTKHHGQSGLIQKVKDSKISEKEAQKQTIAFLKQFVAYKASPMCGNTICQDRRFLYNYMSELEDYFHYRHLDVSTVKELARRWEPQLYNNMEKESKHEALDDIRESIKELKYYQETFFKISGVSTS